jgi:hypothetical protein
MLFEILLKCFQCQYLVRHIPLLVIQVDNLMKTQVLEILIWRIQSMKKVMPVIGNSRRKVFNAVIA